MIYKQWGGPEVLESADLPRPSPAAGELLVRVRATGVNPVDWKIATGKLRMVMPTKLPYVPGFEIAGEVVELGAGATGFAVGDRVHARIKGVKGGGAAEFARVDAEVCAPVPAGMSDDEAAGLPLAGLTALQGLRDDGLLPLEGAKERVLVVGASGGVGHFGVQIARAAGATVVGVCSARNAELVRSLGAVETIDYAAPNPYAGKGPFDLVLDCVGSVAAPWLPLLTPTGRYVSTTPGAGVIVRSFVNAFTRQRVRGTMVKAHGGDLRVLDGLYSAGKLKIVIDSRFPLPDLGKAWERSKSGRAAGKIVVEVA